MSLSHLCSCFLVDHSADHLSLQLHKPLKVWSTQRQTPWPDFKRCCSEILTTDQGCCRADLIHCQAMCLRPGVQVTVNLDIGLSALRCFHLQNGDAWLLPPQWGSVPAFQMDLGKQHFFGDSEVKGTSQDPGVNYYSCVLTANACPPFNFPPERCFLALFQSLFS